MASILDLYGIKEVADVTFYDTVTGAPVLYLDTLKVSTIEETAQNSQAQGGKGNSPLIVWDYGKEINLTLEDALFSMKSMAIMHGSDLTRTSQVDKAAKFTATSGGAQGIPTSIDSNAAYYDENGNQVNAVNIVSGKTYLASWKKTVEGTEANTVTISAANFPGTYRVVGDTFARNQATGRDEFFMFEIPLAKMTAEKTITMQAEGDPSTFSMSLKVLRPDDGNMMKLIKY